VRTRNIKKIYLIGSLRNFRVPEIGEELRTLGVDVFDDWFSPGPHADEFWKAYEQARGRTYVDALRGRAARHIFAFDKHHLDTSDAGVLLYPAGRSAHTELGYLCGQKKPVFVLLDRDQERWDMMMQFATSVHVDLGSLKRAIKGWLRGL
jgi:nucleoside 2-deoxyribosyltransferase